MLKALIKSDESIQTRLIRRKDIIVALLLAAVVVILGSMLIVDGVTAVDHDDGIYLITAKAIAQGEGYRLSHLPDAPVQTKYPPLYPVLLAVIWKLFPEFPDNVLFMQWATLLSGAAAAALSYLYLIRFKYCSRLIACAVVLLCITAPRYLLLSTICMSDMPFALVLVLAIWAFTRHLQSPFASRKSQLLFGMLLALPFLFRSIGLAVVIVAVYYAIRKRRIMLWPAIGLAIAVLPYALWLAKFSVWQNPTSNNEYYTNYVTWWNSSFIPLLGLILKWNSFNIFGAADHIHFSRWPFLPEWITYLIALIGLLGIVSIVLKLRNINPLPKILIIYLSILLIWPWPPFRFMMPILPFLYCYAFNAVIGLFGGRFGILKPVGIGILVIPLIGNADAVRRDFLIGKSNQYPGYMLQSMWSHSVKWSSFHNMFDWIKQNSRPEDLFLSGIDPMLYLYTQRRGIRPFSSRPSSMYYDDPAPALGSLEEIMANIDYYRPQYLVLTPMPGLPEELAYAQFVAQSQGKYPGWIERVYLGEDKRFSVWKIAPTKPEPRQKHAV